MPVTLAQAKELSQDKLTNEIIDDFIASPVLATLPFDDTAKSNGVSLTYVYNRVTTQSDAAPRALNTEYVPQQAATNQETTNLKIMGGSWQIDRVLARDERQVIDLVTFQSREKAKAAVALFHDLFINGSKSTDVLQFDGLKAIAESRSAHIVDAESLDLSDASKIKANGQQLLYALRQAFKGTEGFTHMGMNSDMFAIFQTIADTIPNVSYTRDELGHVVYWYGATRIVGMGYKPGTADEIIETSATGLTDIYLWREGMDGVHGVSPDGSPLVEIHLPNFNEAKAVHTGDVEFVAAIVAKKLNSVAIVKNIKVVGE
ncbi:hypothetical protein G7062_11300 [Erysipelothrix sp. HDW6C]|uniref:major capsid protein n=1 Tax=Erysipelothrix sp. HDW6C TaxID=2714930 RepID=UPI00140BCDBC|nr:hypothetical protein [Erysipelothrix sp. HDW6C]QIK70844.1 hypothetical protein G7062_11300 [Erysipelothrix sp. HDW6C]